MFLNNDDTHLSKRCYTTIWIELVKPVMPALGTFDKITESDEKWRTEVLSGTRAGHHDWRPYQKLRHLNIIKIMYWSSFYFTHCQSTIFFLFKIFTFPPLRLCRPGRPTAPPDPSHSPEDEYLTARPFWIQNVKSMHTHTEYKGLHLRPST
jgi:hypothetical protein